MMRLHFIQPALSGTQHIHYLRTQLSRPKLLRQASTNANANLNRSSSKLDLLAIDKRWKERWCNDPSSQLAKHHGKEKSYVLSMFPYPSGSLHMGHVRVYTISDVLARYKHMKGYDVIHPMGWDAFGLPAENAAIERGINPADWTEQNIANMREQLMALGIHFDWDRELMTCSPSFYKHTQRLFLMLHEKGLAYRAKAMVNYDPVDKTVLANEQVDANGCSWRSGAKVEERELEQWFFRITEFKEALLKDLDTLAGGWPERILSMQRNWLGKSQGARVTFEISTPDGTSDIGVFTTRPDTLHGVQYIALSTNHPLVTKLAETTPSLQNFINKASDLPSDTKEGYRLPGFKAVNPLNALEDNPNFPQSIPVFVAPYVLGDYGEGAVMGVPGHDSRDIAFWKENLPCEEVSYVVGAESPGKTALRSNLPDGFVPILGHGTMMNICGSYSGMPSQKAGEKIISDLKAKTNTAEFTSSWRLRDWLISRQRYWGAPIPIVHCDGCGPVPVPVDQLPVELPKIEGSRLKRKAGNPLESAEEWLHTTCPSCGGSAKRDTDTMDTFVDSSWYFLRFLDSCNESMPFSPSSIRPVDTYIGGIEHAILHLLYSRFIYKFLAKEGLVQDTSDAPEPFLRLLSQGMVHGKTYSDPDTGRFLLPSEVDLSNPNSPVLKGTKIKTGVTFEKMSKSKYNGVDPTTCIDKYGADATRAHMLFSSPVSEILEWDETKIVGIERWFNRVWKVVSDAQQCLAAGQFSVPAEAVKSPNDSIPIPSPSQLSKSDADLLLTAHKAISSVSQSLETNPYSLNTVVSDLIKFTNAISTTTPATTKTSPSATTPTAQSLPALYIVVSSLLRLLSPIAPAFASECWEALHRTILTNPEPPSIFTSPWPSALLSDSDIKTIHSRCSKTVAVQINGKLRFTTTIAQFTNDESSESHQKDAKMAKPDGVKGREFTAEQEWIISQILETDEGKVWLREKNEWEKRKRVVVVGGGKVVNIVF